jgi:hypothetical protein
MAATFGPKLTLNSHPNPPAAATQPGCGLGAVYDNRKSETDVPEGFELRNAVSAAKSVLTLPLRSVRLTIFTT